MTVDRPNSTPTGDASSQKGEDREHPQPTARVENRPSSDRQREALPPGELRAPNKYGVSDDKLPDRVGRLTKTARDYGETADELSGKAAKELRSAETLRDQWRAAMARTDTTRAASLRDDVDAADRRASGTQTELLRVQYKVVTTRYEAMAAARELAAPGSAADDRPPGPVDPKLVVAQTYRDLADDEVRIDPALDEVAKEHLDIALDWAAGAERNAGGDTQRVAWSRGFQAEVFERLGNLKTQWSEGNPDWLTGRNGAFDDYRDAAHLYAKIGDKPNAERVQATRERLEAELGGLDRPQ